MSILKKLILGLCISVAFCANALMQIETKHWGDVWLRDTSMTGVVESTSTPGSEDFNYLRKLREQRYAFLDGYDTRKQIVDFDHNTSFPDVQKYKFMTNGVKLTYRDQHTKEWFDYRDKLKKLICGTNCLNRVEWGSSYLEDFLESEGYQMYTGTDGWMHNPSGGDGEVGVFGGNGDCGWLPVFRSLKVDKVWSVYDYYDPDVYERSPYYGRGIAADWGWDDVKLYEYDESQGGYSFCSIWFYLNPNAPVSEEGYWSKRNELVRAVDETFDGLMTYAFNYNDLQLEEWIKYLLWMDKYYYRNALPMYSVANQTLSLYNKTYYNVEPLVIATNYVYGMGTIMASGEGRISGTFEVYLGKPYFDYERQQTEKVIYPDEVVTTWSTNYVSKFDASAELTSLRLRVNSPLGNLGGGKMLHDEYSGCAKIVKILPDSDQWDSLEQYVRSEMEAWGVEDTTLSFSISVSDTHTAYEWIFSHFDDVIFNVYAGIEDGTYSLGTITTQGRLWYEYFDAMTEYQIQSSSAESQANWKFPLLTEYISRDVNEQGRELKDHYYCLDQSEKNHFVYFMSFAAIEDFYRYDYKLIFDTDTITSEWNKLIDYGYYSWVDDSSQGENGNDIDWYPNSLAISLRKIQDKVSDYIDFSFATDPESYLGVDQEDVPWGGLTNWTVSLWTHVGPGTSYGDPVDPNENQYYYDCNITFHYDSESKTVTPTHINGIAIEPSSEYPWTIPLGQVGVNIGSEATWANDTPKFSADGNIKSITVSHWDIQSNSAKTSSN